MPIHYDIETDELYLAGLEKGREEALEQGIDRGIELHQHETVVRLLRTGRFTAEEIAEFAGVSVDYVRRVKNELNKHQP